MALIGLWDYSYLSWSIICQRQQYGQRDPLPELARLSVPGGRMEHSKGTQMHEGLFAGIQYKQQYEWEIHCQKLLGGVFRFGRKENTVNVISTMIICLPAVVQAYLNNPIGVYQ